jgi:SAM-dependent methyltransferase
MQETDVLARRVLPPVYAAWNRRWGAPFGRHARLPGRWVRRVPRLVGPFGHEANNSTRIFEYPWAFHAVPVVAGSSVVDVGGSLSGYQFVLARSGARVMNIDPGEPGTGSSRPVTAAAHERLNRAFRTDVRLVQSTLEQARFDRDAFDTIYSISTIEHIPAPRIPQLMEEMARVLKPGGFCVLSVDLFLDLVPFSRRTSNKWGTNVAPRALVESSGLDLVQGDKTELLGFPEFDEREILANLAEYLVGSYPALAQCFVLRKPEVFSGRGPGR